MRKSSLRGAIATKQSRFSVAQQTPGSPRSFQSLAMTNILVFNVQVGEASN